MKIEVPKEKFDNLTSRERKALYDLNNNKFSLLKVLRKSLQYSARIERTESRKWRKNFELVMYTKKFQMILTHLLAPYMQIQKKIRKRGDLKKQNVQYFEIKDRKFARIYLLSKVHTVLHDVPGRPVFSNCGYYPKIFLHFQVFTYHLQQKQ